MERCQCLQITKAGIIAVFHNEIWKKIMDDVPLPRYKKAHLLQDEGQTNGPVGRDRDTPFSLSFQKGFLRDLRA